MDVRNLRQVVAIRQHGSFAKAADALGVSQPSLSKSIARLEDELKLKIFDRTAQGSALTPIGELIAERAERVISKTRDLARDAALLAGGENGVVRIGCAAALQHALLPPMLAQVARQHPRLKLYVDLRAGDEMLPLLGSRELDVVFCAHPPPEPFAPSLVVQPFLRAPVFVVASPTHPLARERRIPVARLADFKCAGVGPSSVFANTALLGEDVENLETYTSNNYDALLPIVLIGEAVLITVSFVVQRLIEVGHLVRLDVDWDLSIQFHSVMTRGASFSPILKEITSVACEIGNQISKDWREG